MTWRATPKSKYGNQDSNPYSDERDYISMLSREACAFSVQKRVTTICCYIFVAIYLKQPF